jgi:phosphotriesterase-related protein
MFNPFSSAVTRRQALQSLAAGAVGAALPSLASAQAPTYPKGAIIRTLFKDYTPEELGSGAILFHEHLQLGVDFNEKFIAANAAVRELNALPGRDGGANAGRAGGNARAGGPPPAPPGPNPMRDADLMAEELRETQRAGVACLVDAGHPDMGRDLNFVRQAAMKAGFPVVAGTGFYTQPYYPKEISTMSEEQIYQALLKQIDADPIGALGEIGSWDDMTADERKVFRAVGKVHLATNLPIITHTGIPGKAALEQLDLLEDAGVKPDRIVIGHMGNLVDPNVTVQRAICRRGAFIGIDRQGGNNNDAQQVAMVMTLIDAGFVDHLLFSGDASRGYGRVLTNWVPKVKAAGASDEVIRKITVENPRRLLAFVPKRGRKPQQRS